MNDLETQAINNLANIEDDDDDYQFQPLKSVVINQVPKGSHQKPRPRTVDTKSILPRRAVTISTKRSDLKKHLKMLQEINCQVQTPTNHKRVITSQSLYCMAPSQGMSKSNGFPSHPIKKHGGQRVGGNRYSQFKENTTPRYSKINPEELIREDIMKKFKLRESVRQSQKIAKINNFLKMNSTVYVKNNIAPIFFKKKEQKMKLTLTNLLS